MKGAELENTIQDLLDGSIEGTARALLMEELTSNDAARALYLDFVRLHIALEANAAPPVCIASNVVPMDRVLDRQKKRSIKVATTLAAMMVVVAAISALWIIIPAKQTSTIAASPGSDFSMTAGPRGDGEIVQGNALEVGSSVTLTKGTLELELLSGVRGIVRAPAQFELRARDLIHLNEGTAWFEVPEQAIGFRVQTDDFLVTDLGTEFGVISIPNASDEVHVFSGSVEVKRREKLRKTSKLKLKTGEARRSKGLYHWSEIEATDEPFLKNLPSTHPSPLPPHLHWSFDGDLASRGSLEKAEAVAMTSRPAQTEPTFVSSPLGKALRFNGDQQHLEADWFGIDGARPRSIAFWIRLKRDANEPWTSQLLVWGARDLHAREGWNEKFEILATRHLPDRDARLEVRFGRPIIQTAQKISDDQWQHVAIVFSGESDAEGQPDVQIFINGGQCDLNHSFHSDGLPAGSSFSPIDTKTDPALAFPLTIGPAHGLRHGDQSKYWAELDELYIFEGILPTSEVRKLANPGTTKTKTQTSK